MQVASIEIKRFGSHLVVLGMGRTGRGVRFIKASRPIFVEKMSDEKFKAEMAAAVTEILEREA